MNPYVRAYLFPPFRRRGKWDQLVLDRHRGQSGILFSFRGPSAGNRGSWPTPAWMLFDITVDAVEVRDSPFRPSMAPFWVPLPAGLHQVVLTDVLENELWSASVPVNTEPVVVAVWSAVRGFRARAARVMVDNVTVDDAGWSS